MQHPTPSDGGRAASAAARLGPLALLMQQPRTPPRFADIRQALRRAFREVKFPERVSVSEAARRHRILRNPGAYSGPWKDSPQPVAHLDEPMDALGTTSHYAIVAVMGPSQCGKSEVGNNWQLHTVIYDPADMGFYAPTKELVASYVTTQIDKMISECPDMKARQLDGVSSDNRNLKQFKGCDLHYLWPSGSNFRARPLSRGRIDDYDEFPEDIDEQGNAVSLFEGRQTSFEAYGTGKIYVNSSPKLGPKKGIEALVASGTDKHLWVDCLQCGTPFELQWDRLAFKRDGTPQEAAETACVVCPEGDCGGVHEPKDKKALLATSRWIGKGEVAIPRGKEGQLEPSTIDSYRFDGLFGLAPWPKLAAGYRAAEIAFEENQDEGPLKSFTQTKIGRNYTSRSSADAPATVDTLTERAANSTYRKGVVPDGVVCLTALVDLQVNRFAVQIVGWGLGFRSWIIDRFDILTLNDGRTKLAPFRNAEHWAVLYEHVLAKIYPLQRDPDLRMKIFCTGIDTGGSDDATDNAYAWWHDMVAGNPRAGRPPVPPTAITLIKGGNSTKSRLLPPPTIDAKRQVKGAPQCELFVPNVNRVKDITDLRLRRRVPGPGYVDLPMDMEPGHIAELRAESKVGERWEATPGARNETWDLLVYAFVVMLRLCGMDPNLTNVPVWARAPKPKLPAPHVDADGPTDGPPKAPPPARVIRQGAAPARPQPRRGARIIRAG